MLRKKIFKIFRIPKQLFFSSFVLLCSINSCIYSTVTVSGWQPFHTLIKAFHFSFFNFHPSSHSLCYFTRHNFNKIYFIMLISRPFHSSTPLLYCMKIYFSLDSFSPYRFLEYVHCILEKEQKSYFFHSIADRNHTTQLTFYPFAIATRFPSIFTIISITSQHPRNRVYCKIDRWIYIFLRKISRKKLYKS